MNKSRPYLAKSRRKIYAWTIIALLCGCNAKHGNHFEFSTVRHMDVLASSPSSEPYLFTGGNGKTHLSWLETLTDTSQLKYSLLQGNEWSKPATIISGTGWFNNWADYPTVAVNSDVILAHYLDKSGPGKYSYDVKYLVSSSNGTWSKPVLLNEDGKDAEHGFVSIVPYEDNFFISWLDGRNTAMEGMNGDEHHGAMSLRAAIIDTKGLKQSEWELDSRICDCCQSSAAITTNGPVVVYRDRSEEEIRDMSIVRWLDGRWTEPKSVFKDGWKIRGCPVNGPRIDAIGNDLAVVWFSAPEDSAQVKVAFSMDGGANFGKPIRIDNGKPIGRVDIVMWNETTAVVSWIEESSIKAMMVNADGSKEHPVVISQTSDSRYSGFPQMTRSKNDLIFAWTDDEEKKIKIAMTKVETVLQN